MIQFIRYSYDPEVQRAATRFVNCFAPAPLDHRREHADKTIPAVLASLLLAFGNYARGVQITVH
jgi:hypothetical protein